MNDVDPLARYRRQMRFAPLGEAGQRRLAGSRVLMCGCGALGAASAELLARAGVGFLRLVDRDVLEADNLHRQMLYDEADVAAGLPKAVAAARRLGQINSQIAVEYAVVEVTAPNIGRLADDVNLIVDGTDNFETRYLINDYAVATGRPWVFGGCVGAEGQAMAILPGDTACLACLMPEPPPRELQPTCETAGVIGPIVGVIAAVQTAEALKILSGAHAAVNRRLMLFDLWNGDVRSVAVSRVVGDAPCPTCVERRLPWLTGERGSTATVLCGRDAVQISDAYSEPPDLPALAAKLRPLGPTVANDYLVRVEVGGRKLTIFADGRALVSGATTAAEARGILARFVGA